MSQLFLLDIMKDFINPLRPYWLELSIMVGLLFFLMFLGICEAARKSGRPAWGGFIPFYNLYLLFDIAYRKGWKCLLLLVPIYNIYVLFALPFALAKKFNHKTSFGFFLLLFPFGGYPVLGFDDKKCVDPIPRKKKVEVKTLEEKVLETVPTPPVQISEPNLEAAIPIVPEMPSPLDVLESEDISKVEKSIPEVQVDSFKSTKDISSTIENSSSIFDLESPSFRILKESFDASLKSIGETAENVSKSQSSDVEKVQDISLAEEDSISSMDTSSLVIEELEEPVFEKNKSIEPTQLPPIEVEDSSSIFDLESPSFRILKDSFDASLKDIENNEEFKVQKIDVSVPKESTSLFGKTVTALLKNSMENSLKLVDASISREEPMAVKDISTSKEEGKAETVGMSPSLSETAVEEETDVNEALLDELTTINAMFDQVEEEEKSRKTEIKEESNSMDEESNVLSNEISFIDSLLS